ncbi:hypothetical protein KY289_001120 [Solanum tuberosum]|nr:hypothetical protein KY289_001120 [Solanum tuberosum]
MGRGWMIVDNKFKPRGRGNSVYGYGNENIDGLNDLNRDQEVEDPRIRKGQTIPLTVTNDAEKDKASLLSDKEQYNCQDFTVTYTNAKFFSIIKSYSEDDVHKSIKYNVWASTPNGNKKLDVAYQKAQQKFGGKHKRTSVDFNKNVEYWKQDKWIGCFHVKWHIVKDLPNNLLINVSKTLHPILSVNDR